MRKLSILGTCIIALVTLAVWASQADAYERYNGGCQNCHGSFTDGISPTGSVIPSNDKHTMHRSASNMNTECNLCHTSGDGRDPFIGSSDGTADNPGLGCVGCHGRLEDEGNDSVSNGLGAGLRQHHFNAGIFCGGCHSDSDPANYKPAGEDVLPPYYGTADTAVDDPCNSSGFENWTSGDFWGLDNDGDLLYDGDDPDCTESVCGDGTIDPGETCDDGTANGDTTCGCQADCTLPSAGTSCADGEFCNGDETCDGAGTCQPGTVVDCSDGISCTDDSCNEVSDTCLNTPNNANCADDGQFCNGVEVCNLFTDCTSQGDPCAPGTTCNEDTDTCAQQAQCGDGVIDSGEDCDEGSANGSTPCGCQADCTLPSAGTSCADGEFCNGDETCNGAGACQAGTPVVCDDGVGCTDDSCDEGSDSCENTPNNGNCPDDGQFCTGSEFCDPVNDCSSTGDPCSPGDTCDEGTDVCVAPPVVVDLDIARFSATKSIRLARVKPVTIKLVVKNNGTANAQTRPATVSGWQNGGEVYTETQQVSADAGKGRSTFNFGPYIPTAPGEIMWTVIISDDDPDIDQATAFTSVK
jgi:hypothetical protein